MNPTATMLWWLFCGAAVAVELVTGSLYLLMIAIGLAAGAMGAQVGLGTAAQFALAAVVGAIATALLERRRSRLPARLAADVNPDVNQDIGAVVQVSAWDADRSARVAYRGTTWSARLAADLPPSPGAYVVTAVQGNWLVLGAAPLSTARRRATTDPPEPSAP